MGYDGLSVEMKSPTKNTGKNSGVDPSVHTLLYWLNGASKPTDRHDYIAKRWSRESSSRVVTLITAIRAAGASLKEEFARNPDRNFWTDAPKRLSKAMDTVDKLLAEYQHQPGIEVLGIDPAEGVGADGLSALQINYFLQSKRPEGERLAAEGVIKLQKAQKLYLLRQCVICNTWFLATKSDQATDTVSCRRKAYQQTEEYKSKRREFMRKRYHANKGGQ